MLQSNRVDTLINAALTMPSSVGTSLDKFPVNLWHSWALIKVANFETRSMAVHVDNSDLHEFRGKVADLGENIVAVLAECGEGGERHVTTFLAKRDAHLEGRIYEIEADLIEKYKDRIFDFHIRPVPRDSTGKPELPSGPYFLLTWQASSYGNR
jgi:hypothetical protein